MKKYYNEIFSERLKQAFKDKNVKQIDISTALDINKGAMSSYLAGRYMPKNETLYKIANYLDVNPSWLLGVDLWEHDKVEVTSLTDKEKKIILAYRQHPELQNAVDILLGVDGND